MSIRGDRDSTITVGRLDEHSLMALFSILKKNLYDKPPFNSGISYYLEFSKAVQASVLQLHGMASLLGLQLGPPNDTCLASMSFLRHGGEFP